MGICSYRVSSVWNLGVGQPRRAPLFLLGPGDVVQVISRAQPSPRLNNYLLLYERILHAPAYSCDKPQRLVLQCELCEGLGSEKDKKKMKYLICNKLITLLLYFNCALSECKIKYRDRFDERKSLCEQQRT